LAKIEPNIRKADEFLEGVEYVLARAPECGHRLDDSSVWFISGYTVDLAVYYTFDDNTVHLLAIEKAFPPQL
jgi:hypothetical protein